MTVVPYNLDAWDGYAYEREALYSVLGQLGKKVVVLAGDTHNAWSAQLYDAQQNFVGVELATSSVSSPGMEKYLQIPAAKLYEFEFAFNTLIDELSYCNLNQRGYLTVSFTADEMLAEWKFVNTVKAADYQLDDTRYHRLQYTPALVEIKDLPASA